MLTTTHRRLAAFAVVLFIATVAHALSEPELIAQAEALQHDYQALEVRIREAAETHAVLEADYDALEEARVELEHDRGTLPGCTCLEIDALLADIGGLSDALGAIIGEWQEG